MRVTRGPFFLVALAVAGTVFRILWETSNAASGPVPPDTPTLRPPVGSVAFRPERWFLPADELLGFVEIREGPFLMGSDRALDPLAFDNEFWADTGGRKSVELPMYFIGRYEVTVAQYRAFIDATGHRVDSTVLAAPADHPVANVSWADAVAYARWLDAELRPHPLTPPPLLRFLQEGARVTLPTEAEWEKAARSAGDRIYPWGMQPRRDRANFMSGGVQPVGSIECPECAYGLHDMAGNVWEWTLTPFRAGPYDPSEPPLDLREDALWVMRGGGFADPERNVRAAIRGGADPGARRPFIGFRLAISPR